MIYLLSSDGMKKAEAAAVASGTSYLDLMQNAGTAAAKYILKTVSPKCKTAVILCGQGNNGGDGFVISRELSRKGIETFAVVLGYPATETAAAVFKDLGKATLLTAAEGIERLSSADLIVDALFGTGLSREIVGDAALLINAANETDATRVAIDLPSGAECDSGRLLGCCFSADITLAFEGMKPCHVLPPANAFCGRVEVLPIGIGEKIMQSQKIGAIIPPFSLPKRDKNSHKGSFGTVFSLAGKYGMSGAAVMSSLAALRSGVGIMKLAVIKENYKTMATALPEAVLIPCFGVRGGFGCGALGALIPHITAADAVLVGPGIGVTPATGYLTRECCYYAQKPVIIDADGINSIAGDIEFIRQIKAPLILTPHPGEMARLTGLTVGEIERDRIGVAKRFAEEWGVWLVLKGANTVVATPDGEIFINESGNPGLATGGSGDVLSGIMAAFLAAGLPVTDAVCGAVRIHGDAADRAAKRLGETSLLPRDVIKQLPYLLKLARVEPNTVSLTAL